MASVDISQVVDALIWTRTGRSSVTVCDKLDLSLAVQQWAGDAERSLNDFKMEMDFIFWPEDDPIFFEAGQLKSIIFCHQLTSSTSGLYNHMALLLKPFS